MTSSRDSCAEAELRANPFGATRTRMLPVEPSIHGVTFTTPTACGVTVRTSWEEFAEVVAHDGEPLSSVDAALSYVDEATCRDLKPLSRTEIGDFGLFERRNQYFVAGPKKLGSLLTYLYGVRSFETKETIGLHAALLRRVEDGAADLLLGAAGCGKTTIALAVADAGNYEVLADDWAEVDLRRRVARPVSSLLGVATADSLDELASPYRRRAFSFGKGFYSRNDSPPPQWYELRRILHLWTDHASTSSMYALRKAMASVPFVASPDIPAELSEGRRKRLTELLDDYRRLAHDPSYIRVDIRDRDDAIGLVHDALRT